MSDKNRKDGEFSLPDMREMFEHYTSVEDDEPAAQRSEMEDLARRYLDCGDDETGVESRQESGAVTEEKEPVSEPESEFEPIIESEPEKPAEPKKDNLYKFIPPDDLSGEDIPKVTEPEYPTEQALDDFDMPTDSTFAVNLSERDRGSLREYEREVSENEKNSGSEKGFKKFIKGIIPMKGDAVSEIVRKIVFMAAIITVFVSAGMLINTYLVQPNIVDNDIKDIKPSEELTWD